MRVAPTLVGVLGLVLAASGGALRAESPTPRTASIHGVVRDKQGKPLSWVQIWCDEGRRVAQETGAEGRFVFDNVPIAPCTVTATLLGTPSSGPTPDVTKKVSPGDEDLVLTVDRGAELVVRVEGTRFPGAETTRPLPEPNPGPDGLRIRTSGATFFTSDSMSFGPTRLYQPTRSGWQDWYAAVEHGALAFRRVRPGIPWTLFIGWSESTRGTYLGSGEALKPGDLTVTLEPGREITGTAKIPPPPLCWNGPPRDSVVARRGAVEVPGWVDARSGTFGLPPLPTGPWKVTLRSGALLATADAVAGSALALVPK